jgi:hypothetical protein
VNRTTSRLLSFLLTVLALVLLSTCAWAGPPFLTDDPEPVPWRHYEAYLFGTMDRFGGGSFWTGPAFEFNYGAAPNLQLHVIVPAAYATPQNAYGMGDMELGLKYRFVNEKGLRPQIGAFPMLEVPTGNARLGLGNGQVWARLPIWIQKSSGPWTTYGGAGYQVNHAPGMKDSLFAGWLVQRQLSKRLTLGGESYHQESQAVGARQTTFLDGGGYYNFTPALQLLFMLGHTVTGERHTVGYLGLYYTWGNDHKVGGPNRNRRSPGCAACEAAHCM